MLKTKFQVVSETAIDSKLMQLQAISMNKGESVVEYSSRIIGLVSELENAGHKISVVEQRRALLRGLPKEFDVTAEAALGAELTYHDVVARLIIRETRLKALDEAPEKALMTLTKKDRRCFNCGRRGHFAKECRQQGQGGRKQQGKRSGMETRKCFKCGRQGHLARNCKSEEKEDNENVTAMLAYVAPNSGRGSKKWMLDSACTRHISNCREHFATFTPCSGQVQVGNNDTVKSEGVGLVRMDAVVNGNRKRISLNNVIYAPEMMHNLISVSCVCKKGIRVTIDCDSGGRGCMELMQKKSGAVRMIGLETHEGLYQAVVEVQTHEQAHVAIGTGTQTGIWHS